MYYKRKWTSGSPQNMSNECVVCPDEIRWFWLDVVSNKKEFCYYGTDLSEEQVYNTCIQATVDIDNDLKGGEDDEGYITGWTN